MKFKVIDIVADAGKCHFQVTIQRLPAGRTWTIPFNRKEFRVREEAQEVDKERLAKDRIISSVRESGETTAVGIRDYLLNREYDI